MSPISCREILLAVCFAVNVYRIDAQPGCSILDDPDFDFDELARRVDTASKPIQDDDSELDFDDLARRGDAASKPVCVDNKNEWDRRLEESSSFCLSKGNQFECVVTDDLQEAEKRGGNTACPPSIAASCTRTSFRCKTDWVKNKGALAKDVCRKEVQPADLTDIPMYYTPDGQTKCRVGKKNVQKILDKVSFAKNIPKCKRRVETEGLLGDEEYDESNADYEESDESSLASEAAAKKPSKAQKAKNQMKKVLKKVPKPKLPKPVASVKAKFKTIVKTFKNAPSSNLQNELSSSGSLVNAPGTSKQSRPTYDVMAARAEDVQAEIQDQFQDLMRNDEPEATVVPGNINIMEEKEEAEVEVEDLINFDSERKKRENKENVEQMSSSLHVQKIFKRILLQVEETQGAAPSLEFSFTVQYPVAEASTRDLQSEVKSMVETLSDIFESKVIPGLGIDKNSITVSRVRLFGVSQSSASDDSDDSTTFLIVAGALMLAVIVILVLVGAFVIRRTKRQSESVQMQDSGLSGKFNKKQQSRHSRSIQMSESRNDARE